MDDFGMMGIGCSVRQHDRVACVAMVTLRDAVTRAGEAVRQLQARGHFNYSEQNRPSVTSSRGRAPHTHITKGAGTSARGFSDTTREERPVLICLHRLIH